MDCKNVRSRLHRFHDGELDTVARATVEMHLGHCPLCATELAAIAELSEMARVMAEPEPPALLWNQINCQLPPARSVPFRRLTWPVAAAAALFLIAVIAGWWAHRTGSQQQPVVASGTDTGEDNDPVIDHLLTATAVEPVSLSEAARQVDFRVLAAADLADGYRLKECCLCPCGCCPLVCCKFLRGADQVLLVQGSPDHPLRYGDRPSVATQVNGKPVRIVQCEGCLAAAWQTPETAFTLIGPRDLSELVRLMASVDKRLADKP